ncbi:MAG: glycosyl transferase, family 9 [Chloroflexi bacterium]|jgi:ADP-heptose:LPS heptosyltransferase|nr:glycosyl transferase, family 9 [Chloroflexota bacterium]
MTDRAGGAVVRPARILVWLSGALGDTLLGFPALRAIRAWAPGATITVVGRPAYLILARDIGLINVVEGVDDLFASQAFVGAHSASLPFDVAIVWSSAHQQIADWLEGSGVFAVSHAPPRGADRRHQARYLLDTLASFEIQSPVRLPTRSAIRRLTGHVEVTAEAQVARRVLLHPGAGARWKRWPLDHYLTLAEQLQRAGADVHWSVGPADGDLQTALAIRAVPGTVHVDLSLQELVTLLAGSSGLVSADTGIAHLAALLRVRSVTVFAPTDPLRWRPLGKRAVVVRAAARCGGAWALNVGSAETSAEMALRRCADQSLDSCPCLAALNTDVVFHHLQRCLSRAGT